MSKILTNNQYYYQIADAIREQNGTNNTYKPQQMASALKDLFYEEVEGVPPISFNGIGENLLDYRIDGASGGVGDRTKNFIQNTATTQTKNGVTFTVNEDKSISCNGTASSNAFFKIGDIQLKKNCIMSGCPEGGANNSYVMRLYNNGSVFKTDSGDGVLINSEIQNGYAEIRIAAGYTCDNLTFYPMIRLAEIEDNTYEPYGYKVPVVVNGGNLFNKNDVIEGSLNPYDGKTIIYNNQLHTKNYIPVTANDVYIISGLDYGIRVHEYNSNHNFIKSYVVNNNNSFTVSNNCAYIRAAGSINQFLDTGMINLGSTSLPYEPYIEETTNIYLDNPIRTINDEVEYIDYSEQKQHRVRKNLLQNTATSQTKGRDESDPETYPGVTFTVNDDKSVICNGASNQTTYIYLCMDFIPEEGITYLFSGCPQNGDITSYELDLINPNGIIKKDIGNGITFDSTSRDGYLRVRLRIASGYTCNNLTFYPMIRKVDIEDDTYEQYIENTEVDVTLPAIPTLDGTNTLSIDTTVQPSNVYVKSRHESSYEAAMREDYEEQLSDIESALQEV